jgi:hypothetical protein
LRAQRSNPSSNNKKEWIASLRSQLCMFTRACRHLEDSQII